MRLNYSCSLTSKEIQSWILLEIKRQPHRVHRNKNLPMHISIKVQIRFPRSMHSQRIRRDPSPKKRCVVPLPKVNQPNLNVIFLPVKR